MMDDEFLKAIVVGVSSALTTLSVVPLLVKGKIRHERELLERDEHHAKEIKMLKEETEHRIRLKNEWHAELVASTNAERDRLLEEVEKQDDELHRQYEVIRDMGQQVFAQISFLQSLSGLAAQDRRSSSRAGS